jgi:hypothetical protein
MDQLSDGIRKLILAGIGAVAATKEKSEVILDELVKKGELTVEQGKVLNEELKHNIKDAIRDNVTLHIVTDEDDEEKPEDGRDESEAAPQGNLMDAVDSMDDEQLAALKSRIQAAEAARAEKNETPKESSSDENTEG